MAHTHLIASRLNRGLSIADAAEEIGVTYDILEGAEKGRRPHPRNALKIASFYDRKVTDLWPIDEPDEVAA